MEFKTYEEFEAKFPKTFDRLFGHPGPWSRCPHCKKGAAMDDFEFCRKRDCWICFDCDEEVQTRVMPTAEEVELLIWENSDV